MQSVFGLEKSLSKSLSSTSFQSFIYQFPSSANSSSFATPEMRLEFNNLGSETSSSTVSASPVTEEDIKHEILTEKAKMNIKPHLPGPCRDYNIMVSEENDFKNEPEWDSSEQCLMRDMIESKRTNAYAHDSLKKFREEYISTSSERDKQIKELVDDELAFGASFIHYDRFVKENIEKRERAFEKLKAEESVRASIVAQIKQADAKIETLTEIKNDMLESIAERKIYVDFMEKVRAVAPSQFSNGVHEIADRFELLLRVREKLANEQAEAVKEMQELRSKTFRTTDECHEEMIKLQNQITEARRRYSVAKYQSLCWESLVNLVEETSAQRSRDFTKGRDSIWDLYLEICRNHGLPTSLQKNQIQEQLGFIEDTIILLRRALVSIRKSKKDSDFIKTAQLYNFSYNKNSVANISMGFIKNSISKKS